MLRYKIWFAVEGSGVLELAAANDIEEAFTGDEDDEPVIQETLHDQ